MSPLRKLFISMVAGLAFVAVACPVNADEPVGSVWPSTVVKMEDLRPLTSLKLRVPGVVTKGRVTGPAILRVHISAEGAVVKTTLLESCGNTDLDEASLHAMRVMRFSPHTVDGVPVDVTLVVPFHIPKRLGRSQ